jgi:hypothetical protein
MNPFRENNPLTVTHRSGVFWNGVQIDATTLEYYGTWDTAQMSHAEFAEHCTRSATVLKKITTMENLERPLADVIEELKFANVQAL